MKIGFTTRTPGEIDFGLLFGGIALAVLGTFRFLPVAQLLPPCAWHRLFGIPCPTCGTTRSLVHLAHGELAASLCSNPLASIAVTTLLAAFAFSMLSSLFKAPRFTFTLSEGEKNIVRISATLSIVLNWGYLIIDGR